MPAKQNEKPELNTGLVSSSALWATCLPCAKCNLPGLDEREREGEGFLQDQAGQGAGGRAPKADSRHSKAPAEVGSSELRLCSRSLILQNDLPRAALFFHPQKF